MAVLTRLCVGSFSINTFNLEISRPLTLNVSQRVESFNANAIRMTWLTLFFCVLLGSWISSAHGDDPQYAWKKITLSAPWAARDGAGVLSYRGSIWLLGGWNPGNRDLFPRVCSNDVWSSTNGLDWTLVRANTFSKEPFDSDRDWEGRHTAGYVVFRDRMWIVGGDCNQGHYQNDIWSSEDGKNWIKHNQNKDLPWGPRALHYTFVHQNKIWVIGGQTMPGFAPSDEKFYRDIWISEDGQAWQQVEAREPYWSARGMIGGSAVMNGRIWILGGGTYDTPKTPKRNFYNDVWSSENGVDWTLHTAHAPWHPRQYHDVAVWDNRLWVMEGYHENGGNRNDVWYSENGVDWQELKDTPWKARHAAGLIVHNGNLWLLGGNNMQPDVWILQRID